MHLNVKQDSLQGASHSNAQGCDMEEVEPKIGGDLERNLQKDITNEL